MKCNGAERQPREGAIAAAVPGHAGALLTIADVAALLRVPTSWVYEKTRSRASGRLPGFRLGKYWRFRESEILAWLDRQRAGTKPNA